MRAVKTKHLTINATNLKIDNHEDLNKGDSVNLLTNAKNLNAGKTVTGASHSQEQSVTDNNSSINFKGALIGNVSTKAETVQYTLNDRLVQTIDLKGWNGKTFNENLSDWTPTGSATIATDGMSAPVGLLPGDTVTIMQDASGKEL